MTDFTKVFRPILQNLALELQELLPDLKIVYTEGIVYAFNITSRNGGALYFNILNDIYLYQLGHSPHTQLRHSPHTPRNNYILKLDDPEDFNPERIAKIIREWSGE